MNPTVFQRNGQRENDEPIACGSAGEESTCNAGDLCLTPGLGRYPGEGSGYLLQSSGRENSMYCIVYGVAKCQTRPGDFYFQLKPNLTMTQNQYSSHIHFYLGPSPQIFSCLHCYLSAISLWRCNKIKKKERKWRCSVMSNSSWPHGL